MKDRTDLKAEDRSDYLGEMLVSIFNPKGLREALDEIDRDFRLMAKRTAAMRLEEDDSEQESSQK